ncbi:hypothetical protein KR009_001197 [Drosophila setifemur]|nr:hypothetical protein KR009_001197 [Drosophila setifemur]
MLLKANFYEDHLSKKPIILELRNSATIYDLKVELQKIVNINADRQEISSMTKQVDNFEKLSALFRRRQLSEDRPDVDDAPDMTLHKSDILICDLNFYNGDEAEYPEYADSQETILDGHSLSSLASTSSAAFGFLKDCLPIVAYEQGSLVTMLGPQLVNFAGSCCKQEPKCEAESEDEDDNFSIDECPDPAKDCCNRGCDRPDNRPAYARILPENRQFCLMITNQDPEAEAADERAIMRHFFNLFENCKVNNLEFSKCTSMAKVCVNLMIACRDDTTADWVTSAVEGVCPPHSCLPFIEFFRLIRASFVLPLIVPEKTLCSIFELLELQNCGLSTDKWAVVERKMLCPSDCDYDEKAVSSLCDNEEIVLYLDADSKELILEQCSQLKYCFWRLRFDFCC